MLPEDQKNITTQWWSTARHFTAATQALNTRCSKWNWNDEREKPYLNLVNIDKYRHPLGRLGMSSHRFKIEAGRRYGANELELNQSKCKHCDTLEEELHFLFEWQIYEVEIKIYIKNTTDHDQMSLIQATDGIW